MSLPVWCELICDECSTHLAAQWHSGSHIPREALKAEAERGGAVVRDNTIICPKCERARKAGASDKGETTNDE